MVLNPGSSSQARADETPPLVFVTEYVRGLASNEDARIKAERDIRDTATANEKLSSAVYGSTLIQLELQSQIHMLRDMHLNPPFDQLIPTIVELYQGKIALLQKMIDASSAILAGPNPNVDYSTLVGELPKIRALLDDIDHLLFKITPMVFATLIDSKPDSANHVNHLIIKKEQREALLNDLTIDFG